MDLTEFHAGVSRLFYMFCLPVRNLNCAVPEFVMNLSHLAQTRFLCFAVTLFSFCCCLLYQDGYTMLEYQEYQKVVDFRFCNSLFPQKLKKKHQNQKIICKSYVNKLVK